MKLKLKKIYLFLIGIIPHPFPVNEEEFKKYSEELFFAYSLPSTPPYVKLVAMMIMNHRQTSFFRSKLLLAICVKKAMANEAAYQKIEEFKQLQLAEIEKAKKDSSKESLELVTNP